MPDSTDQERFHRLEQEMARLRQRLAAVAASLADTEERIAEVFERAAERRSSSDAEWLRRGAEAARAYAAKQRERSETYGMPGTDED